MVSPLPPSAPSGPPVPLVYRIDADDRFAYFDPNWLGPADAGPPPGLHPDALLGRRIWDVLVDPGVINIYRLLVKRVRGGAATEFSYRCDLPEVARTFRMRIHPHLGTGVEFTTWLERAQSRHRVRLLAAEQPRDERTLVMCSFCQRVNLPNASWIPIELAAAVGGFMNQATLPQLQAGICQSCREQPEN